MGVGAADDGSARWLTIKAGVDLMGVGAAHDGSARWLTIKAGVDLMGVGAADENGQLVHRVKQQRIHMPGPGGRMRPFRLAQLAQIGKSMLR
eukprot:170958-Prorocentrum_minimum.AAC.1